MNPVRLSPEAEEDIRNIYRYGSATWSVAQAESYFFTIFDVLEAAADGRVTSRPSDDVRAGYLRVIIKSHIAYVTRSDDGSINVIRILHQSQDGKRHL